MFIQTQDTPNPATLKFIPGVPVLEQGTADFPAADSAGSSPMARRLFQVDGVAGVFLGGDFIAVTKVDDMDWFALKPSILAGIMEHFASGLPVIEDNAGNVTEANTDDEDDDDTVKQIKHLLDTRVRPAVAMDGGDIVFQAFDDGVVTLQMRGACQGCPSSTATLKMGIENMLKHYIPQVREVRAADF
ncbi:NifU family protein [Candidatus Puniceispirillum sp.]|uniref:NifU family protein n=1 Tax=Candidatus Puniceispirillum sp. TaxID=2026719 RepID=UPI003F69DC7D